MATKTPAHGTPDRMKPLYTCKCDKCKAAQNARVKRILWSRAARRKTEKHSA